MAKEKRYIASDNLKQMYENALSKADGVNLYIPKYCASLTKIIENDMKKNRVSVKKIFTDITTKLINPEFWNDKTNFPIVNQHGGYVGKIVDEYGNTVKIIKRSANKSDRIYFCRYFAPNNVTYVKLLGYQLKGQRDLGWKEEVRNIINRTGGVIFDDIKPFVPDSVGGELDIVKRDSHLLKMHSGFICIKDNLELTENYIEDLLNEANICITDDQFEQIAKKTPLLIDGHAGTGKSIIIALRIAAHFKIWDSEDRKDENIPNLLVVAYNKRVLDMIEKYVNYWISKMIPEFYEKYLDRIHYLPTLNLYHQMLKKEDYSNIPIPTSVEANATFVNFYKFKSEFFNNLELNEYISAEQAWHFIRGVLKGRELGWHGSEKITLDDFSSITGKDGKISRKVTEKMSSEMIENLLNIHYKYEQWRKENKYLDDIDLVRRAMEAIEFGNSKSGDLISKYHTTLIDEGQDLTIVEFKLLTYLLKEYPGKINIVVGGDPLQTINPTGFSWENLETFITRKVIEDSGNDKFDIRPSRMLVSHRMPKSLVDFANVIINARGYVSDEDVDLMKALDEHSTEGFIARVSYDVNDEEQREKMSNFIQESLGSDIGTIIWSRDSKELQELKSRDKTLDNLTAISSDGGISEDIHSIESVKGLEFETVILYRFGDLADSFNKLVNESLSLEKKATSENLYELLYFLNRLFIAATRSKKNIIIIDSNESIEENWNSKLWGAGNQTILGLDDFFEQIETKPTLTKANQYFEIGKERRDLELLHKAFASAKRCENTDERRTLLINIEITILQIETNSNIISDKDKIAKRRRLVELYEQIGDHEKAIYERVILNDWLTIYEKYKNKRQYKLIWHFAASIITNDPNYLNKIIDTYASQKNDINNLDVKRLIARKYKEILRKNLSNIENKYLKIIEKEFDGDDWIELLEPDWDDSDTAVIKNSKKSDNFMKQMESKFGKDHNSWPNRIYAKILRIQLKNPNCIDPSRIVDELAAKGDPDAVKNAISNIFTNNEGINVDSRIWLDILKFIESSTYLLEEKHSSREIMIQRLRDVCSILDIRKGYTGLNLNEFLEALNSVKRIQTNPVVIGSSEVDFIKDGAAFNGFEIILKMNDEKIQRLIEFILNQIVSTAARTKDFLSWDWENCEKFMTLFDETIGLEKNYCQLGESIISVAARDNISCDPRLIRYILKGIDNNKKKYLRLERRYVENVQHLFELNDWFDWYWKYPGTVKVWVLQRFKGESQEKINFHVLVKKWKDSHPEDMPLTPPSDELAFLAEKEGFAKPELRLEVKKAKGYDEDDMINDFILQMDINDLRKRKVSKVNKSIDSFEGDYESIIWKNNNWFSSNFSTIKTKKYSNKDVKKQIIHYSIFSDSFAQMVLEQFPAKEDKADLPCAKDLLGNFWISISNGLNSVIQSVFNESRFWEKMLMNGSLGDCLNPPTRKGKDNFDVYSLAVIDVLTMFCKIKNKTGVIAPILKDIGLLNVKSFASNDDLCDAIFKTKLFTIVFKEFPDLVESAKELMI